MSSRSKRRNTQLGVGAAEDGVGDLTGYAADGFLTCRAGASPTVDLSKHDDERDEKHCESEAYAWCCGAGRKGGAVVAAVTSADASILPPAGVAVVLPMLASRKCDEAKRPKEGRRGLFSV